MSRKLAVAAICLAVSFLFATSAEAARYLKVNFDTLTLRYYETEMVGETWRDVYWGLTWKGEILIDTMGVQPGDYESFPFQHWYDQKVFSYADNWIYVERLPTPAGQRLDAIFHPVDLTAPSFASTLISGEFIDTYTYSRYDLTRVTSAPLRSLSIVGFDSDETLTPYANWTSAAAAIPEPASWAMLVGGFGVIGAMLRRRGRVAVRLA
jgi:hypothetical protein